jgi:TusA-related sulfurtransferase
MTADADMSLDVSGVCCPLPLIRLAQAMKSLTSGQTLVITGNDPIFERSVREFCTANRHEVLEVSAAPDRRVTMRLRVGGGA